MRTTDDDDEILRSLKFVMSNTATLALMHESVNVNSLGGHDFTRSWFAWCNSEFGKTILHLAKHKPHLIFRSEYSEVSYNIDKVLSELV
jgi:meiotically up-regulated gene 157 (Mug157) protein